MLKVLVKIIMIFGSLHQTILYGSQPPNEETKSSKVNIWLKGEGRLICKKLKFASAYSCVAKGTLTHKAGQK